ncbi:MAG: phosphoenolpyruvate-utilizing N-terminal domain-containing protein [Solirubrobacteraceae bacterium]
MAEPILEGLAAAPGLAVGRARLAHARVESRERIAEPRRPLELHRARAALSAAGTELEAVAVRLHEAGRADEAEIVCTGC